MKGGEKGGGRGLAERLGKVGNGCWENKRTENEEKMRGEDEGFGVWARREKAPEGEGGKKRGEWEGGVFR